MQLSDSLWESNLMLSTWKFQEGRKFKLNHDAQTLNIQIWVMQIVGA